MKSDTYIFRMLPCFFRHFPLPPKANRAKANRNGTFALFAACATILLSMSLVSVAANAQMKTTVASNKSVAADVWNGSGFIDFYVPDGNNKDRLSFSKFSFLTVEVNGNFYTNNNNLNSFPLQPKAPTLVLTNGAGVLIRDKANLGNDTIRTTWTISNSFQIIQDVFPVVFTVTGSGQIVYKVSVKNLLSSAMGNVQAQYLLDNDISTNSPPTTNDNDTLATRAGYSTNWITFPNADYPGIPPFELAFEEGLCSSAGFPGLIGVGFTNDSLAPEPMGLMTPETYTFLDNQYVIATTWTWGFPQSYIGSAYRDAATLIQWPSSGVDPNSETEIACGSYGVQQCQTCEGNLFGLIFHPEHIRWEPGVGYNPSPFPVEAIIFDPQNSAPLTSAKGTQTTVDPAGSPLCPVKIFSPIPVTNNGQTQQHSIAGNAIQSCNLGDIMWLDSADNSLVNCSTDSIYTIEVSVQGNGVGQPFFITPVTNLCPCPIEVDCQQKDLKPPRFVLSKPATVGRYDTAVMVTDDLIDDQGLLRIDTMIEPTGSKCDSIHIGSISSCPPTDMIYVWQKDTTCATCVTFTATDCAGNVADTTICFGAKVIPGHPDAPPVFHLLQRYNWNDSGGVVLDTTNHCNSDSSSWNVTDSITGDLGLVLIKVISNDNMILAVDSFPKQAKIANFSVYVSDRDSSGSIILEAIDDSNHVAYDTINYCTVLDTHAPFLNPGNPVPGVSWTVTVWDSTTALWDRGVDTVFLIQVINCKPVQVPGNPITIIQNGSSSYYVIPNPPCSRIDTFDMVIIDSFEKAQWTGQVKDCAGNVNTPLTNTLTPDSDTFCPQWDTTHLSNPPRIHVVVKDIHYDGKGNIINYDLGIDSIWFRDCPALDVTLSYHGKLTPSSNGTLPTIIEPPVGTVGVHTKYPVTDSFDIIVTDTSLQGLNSACVCFNASDGASNLLCQPTPGPINWCHSLVHDTNAPQVLADSSGCLTLNVIVTDSLYNDDGIYRVWIDSNIGSNFKPFDNTLTPSQKTLGFSLTKINSNLSAYAHLSALDLYGKNGTPADRIAHTDSMDVWMYRQDLSMNTNKLDSLPGTFTVPVYLVWTDSIPLSQKQLTAFQFQFHLTGSDSAKFAGATTPLAGWTVVPVVAGQPLSRYYTVSGQGPALNALSNVIPLVNLNFAVTPDSVLTVTEIVIDTDQCQAAVVYNNGNDTTVSGKNYSVTLPASTGKLNGGTIILKGICTPVLSQGALPSIISLAPTVPNPTANSTLVVYTIPTDAPVSLDLYNALGEKVRTLVSEVEKQGDYRIQLDGSGLTGGTYFLRLASGGHVVSRRIVLSH